jgi:hypothetical protein
MKLFNLFALTLVTNIIFQSPSLSAIQSKQHKVDTSNCGKVTNSGSLKITTNCAKGFIKKISFKSTSNATTYSALGYKINSNKENYEIIPSKNVLTVTFKSHIDDGK